MTTSETATAEIVRRLREQDGLKIHEAAYAAGVSEKTWRRVEKGFNYDRLTIRKIAKQLHVRVGDLEPVEEAPPPPSQLDRIEAKLNLLVALARGRTVQEEAWEALALELGLDDPPLERHEDGRA